MRLCLRHRWISYLGLLAMISALVGVPAASFAAVIGVTPVAMSDVASSHAGTAHAGMAHEHGAVLALTESMPGKSCPQCPKCPKPCSGQASCFLKCFQNSGLAAPADGTEHFIVRNVVWPKRIAAVRSASVPPLLRPPSL